MLRPPDCIRCGDRGYTILTSGESGIFEHGPCPEPDCKAGAAARAQEAQRRVEAQFRRAVIPERFADATMAGVHQPADKLRDVRAALDAGLGLFLWGNVGNGKTYLACAILREQLAAGKSGMFIEVPDLLDAIRDTYSEGSKVRESQLLETVRKVDWLVLDDLGVEEDRAWVVQKLYQIVNGRYCDCLPIIATSNLRPDRLAKKIGPRIVSRLQESCREIEFSGDDRRLGGL